MRRALPRAICHSLTPVDARLWVRRIGDNPPFTGGVRPCQSRRVTITVGAARDRIAAQAATPSTGEDFASTVMNAVHDVAGFDGFVLLGFDPESGLRSFMFSRDGASEHRRLTYNEWHENDVNRYVGLAAAALPVGVLQDSTHEVVSSPRLQEILRPGGIMAELRLALRDRSRLWGALVLYRADPRDRFTDDDVQRVLEVAEPLREAIIRYPMRHQVGTRTDAPAGVLVLDEDDNVVSLTAAARTWLAEAVAGGMGEETPERIHRAVYEVARAARGQGTHETAPIARLRTSSGCWIAITGSVLDAPAGHVAVILQQASLGQVLPAASAWFRLTSREAEVLRLLSHGGTSRAMAQALHMSQHTVNDHLTAIYRKAGVRGRDELLALLT